MHLTEALWPDAEGDTAVRSLHTTLHRLRKALGANNLIEVGQGMVSLNPRRVWVDVWALERLLSEIDSAENARLVSLGDDLLQLYQGHFLERETDPHWALSLRERLRTRFIRGLLHLGERLIEIGEIKTALLLFERGAELDPLSESLQRPLIACYALLNRCSDALGTYAKLREALEETLGITPSLETEALVDAVRQGDANHPLLERYSSCIDTAVRD
jgi:DNA-binding SARP family transcriptional activator